MSRLKAITTALRLGKPPPAHITPGPDIGLVPINGGKQTLRSELETLYWQGVATELENIIRTLQAWQKPAFADISNPDEVDCVHGFDFFIDQVSQEARKFAIRQAKGNNSSDWYETVLRQVAVDRRAEYVSTKLKSSVRKGIDALPKLDGMEWRAWALLQAAGFLDIDKLIEYRPPPARPERPAIPQLTFELDSFQIPRFQPLYCSRPDCNRAITGSMFVSDDPKDPATICEDCYWQHYYGDDSYTKTYKHCVLQDITPETSRQLCSCKTVARHDASGKPVALFPIDKEAKHLDVGGHGTVQCSLLKLGELACQAKYNGLLESVGMKDTKVSAALAKVAAAEATKVTGNQKSFTEQQFGKVKTAMGMNLDEIPTEAETDPDIPPLLRAFARKDPFGDVHMALRVGPLVIENGVANTKSGALVTLREPPVFHERFSLCSKRDTALVVAGTPDRTVWKQRRKPVGPKRYQAVMKQVAGAPFTGLLPLDGELDVVRDLLAISTELSMKKQAALDTVIEALVLKLKKLLQSHVQVYLDSIAARLLDPCITLTWSAAIYSCQSFCNSLINTSMFEPLVSKSFAPGDTSSGPLYLFSFVTRSPPESGYLRPNIKSKYDVPPGHTEEYLLRFHFGHDSSDLIDTCREYWTDWANLDGLPHPETYHALFPWDCTEAYGSYLTLCGGTSTTTKPKKVTVCNLSKHIWAFPFDAWSFLSHHLTRERCLYAPTPIPSPNPNSTTTATTPQIPDPRQTWLTNRLTLLHTSTLLTRVACAMSRTPLFHASTGWLHSPSSSLLASHPVLARVKLGGIHRAQPSSHYFDTARGAGYFLAEWALWTREERIREYEKARGRRVGMGDVPAVREPGAGVGGYVSYSGDGVAGRKKGKGKGKREGGGEYAGFDGGDERRTGGGGGARAWDWQVQTAVVLATLDTADCGFTAKDMADASAGAGGGPGCAVNGLNCGSCYGSATACGGGSSGGGGGGGGGGGDAGGGGDGGGGGAGCGSGCGAGCGGGCGGCGG